MTQSARKTIRFRGKSEPVLETFRVRGRSYFALEKLSRRGAYRVFDSHAGHDGDLRVLYRFAKSDVPRQRLEVLRRLSGPNANRNFPGIVDFTYQGDDLFVVIAWVHGVNLAEYLSAIREGKTARPSVSEVVRLVRGLAHGLSHYHRRTNIIHGDISPANIVLTTGTKQLVLIDFGSAWPVQQSSDATSGDGFTMPYAAPERMAKNVAVDFRTDLFSLSVVAYEMLTLSIPYDGLGGQAGLPHLIDKMAGSYRDPSPLIPSAHRLTPRIRAELDRCLQVGLKLRPDERFATSSVWLSAWDDLHFTLSNDKPRSKFESLLFSALDRIFERFPIRDRSRHDRS